MIGPASRIIARWIAGGLVALGIFLPEDARAFTTDPDTLLLIGGAIGITTEWLYKQAKKRGWNL